ncbi:MAG: tetratricopeptide repeat protein [Croceitalea sp.]|nr:tetratricopeptide repeat protein [Croceitalea sp.]NNL08170.1 tetratricopeptide repeat protein [Croceitalea sp.]
MRSKLLFILLFLFTLFGRAQNNVLFEKATEAYNDGRYEKALEFYEQILTNGQHSSELYFNMGNAFYKLNQIGPSVYYYEKALLLSPNDSEIINNLGYAKNMRLDAIEEMPETAFAKFYGAVVNYLSFEQWSYLAVALMMVFVLGYIVYYLMRLALQKRIAFVVSILSLLLSVAALVLAYLQYEDYKSNNPAIVFAREIAVTAEPNNRSERVFSLHEGTKVNVVDELGDWNKIRIADGQTGWLPSNNIKLLKDF